MARGAGRAEKPHKGSTEAGDLVAFGVKPGDYSAEWISGAKLRRFCRANEICPSGPGPSTKVLTLSLGYFRAL